jgi:hypothetical protein
MLSRILSKPRPGTIFGIGELAGLSTVDLSSYAY